MKYFDVSNVHHSFSRYEKQLKCRKFNGIYRATLCVLDTEKSNFINYREDMHK